MIQSVFQRTHRHYLEEVQPFLDLPRQWELSMKKWKVRQKLMWRKDCDKFLENKLYHWLPGKEESGIGFGKPLPTDRVWCDMGLLTNNFISSNPKKYLLIQNAAKVSFCNHTTCACVNNTQRCSLCSWLGVSMCKRHSCVMFALYCVNTEIKMQLLTWSTQKMNAFLYSFRISATMRITPWFWQNLQNISQN